LYNWLYARRHGGVFILRIEDTDQARSTEESTGAILESMKWLGLDWDEGPFYQSERREIYLDTAKRLIDEGKAYYCNCDPAALEEKRKRAIEEGRPPVYDGTCRQKGMGPGPDTVIRLKTEPCESIVIRDLIKGPITVERPYEDDFILIRKDGFPTYNFAVVVDDALMGISHVIRGDDHVNNTPRQIMLYEALGLDIPWFAHVPMILGEDRTRLSKRHGAVSVTAYRDMGYLPDAMVNYLVRLGWAHGDQEIFSREELIRFFSLEKVGKSPAVFNPEKLLWLNQHYLKETSNETILPLLKPFWNAIGITQVDDGTALWAIDDLKPRAKTLTELAESSRFYFTEEIEYQKEAARDFLTPEAAPLLEKLAAEIPHIPDYSREGIHLFLKDFVARHHVTLKVLSQPLRVSLSGRTAGPGLDQIMRTLGKERVVSRLKKAVAFITAQSATG